jgi:signal transduction histidine kinase
MASQGAHTTRLLTTERLERPVVRIIAAITASFAVVLLIAAEMAQDPAFRVHAALSFFTALLAIVQIVAARERTYVLVATTASLIAANLMLGVSTVTVTSSLVALVVIGMGATLFVRRSGLHIAVFAVALMAVSWVALEGPAARRLLEGTTIAVVFAFGAGVIDWIRRQAEATRAGYEHLFRTAPVSLWREDFSGVQRWLTALRAAGVTDLARYLDDRPEQITEAGRLIEVTEVNQAAVELLEAANPAELTGHLNPMGMTAASRSSVRDQLIGVWDGETHIITEVRNGRTMKGNRVEGLLSFTVPRHNGEPDYSNVTVAIVDITDSRKAHEQLEQLVRSKDQLVAAVSHELRTPLTAVVGLAGELASSFDTFEAREVEEFIRMIAAQSEDVSLIVEDLLVAAQAESGTIHVRPEPTSITDQIELVIEGLRSEHSISVELPHPIGRAFADPGRVRQIIRNLITNAERYGSPPTRVVLQAIGDKVAIEVRDSGAPLPNDQRRTIFDRYQRAKERPGVAASVGVGLTVSRELARTMGGDLTYGHDGETVFTLTLPKWTGQGEQLAG